MSHNRVLAFLFAALLVSFAVPAAATTPTDQQYTDSFAKLYQKAQAGDPDAEYAVGYMYFYGKGTTQDSQMGISWIHKAAAQGQPVAVKALGILDADQNTGIKAVAQRKTNEPTAKVVTSMATQNAMTATQTSAVAPAKVAAMSSAMENTMNSGDLVANANQLMTLPANEYTIQLTGAGKESEITAYINQFNLQGRATYYRTSYQGRDWYVLIYGQYKTVDAAKAAIQQLPDDLKNLKPWVKPLALVQTNIREMNSSLYS